MNALSDVKRIDGLCAHSYSNISFECIEIETSTELDLGFVIYSESKGRESI